MLRLTLSLFIAWIAGLLAYEITLRVVWHQSSGSDLSAVAVWSGITAIFAALVLYTPLLSATRKLRGGYSPRYLFTLLPVILCFIPTAALMMAWGGGLRDTFSTEGRVFLVLFATFGAVFGFGYTFQRAPSSR